MLAKKETVGFQYKTSTKYYQGEFIKAENIIAIMLTNYFLICYKKSKKVFVGPNAVGSLNLKTNKHGSFCSLHVYWFLHTANFQLLCL
jgi:hypothetical protein